MDMSDAAKSALRGKGSRIEWIANCLEGLHI